MKSIFIHAKSPVEIVLSASAVKKLPKKIGLVTTIQHLHQLGKLKKQLKNAIVGGQILGCRVDAAEKIKNRVDAFLYIGSGEFHPLGVALKTEKPVFIWNPSAKKLTQLEKNQVDAWKKKRKTALIKFLSAQNLGILVSTKHGQQNMKRALELKKKLGKKGKDCYLFVFDTLDFSQLENFPFIKCWINTACPRIVDGRSDIINLEEIQRI